MVNTSYFDVDCDHSKECNRKGVLCGSCKNNKQNKQKNFYQPVRPFIYTPRPGTIGPEVTFTY